MSDIFPFDMGVVVNMGEVKPLDQVRHSIVGSSILAPGHPFQALMDSADVPHVTFEKGYVVTSIEAFLFILCLKYPLSLMFRKDDRTQERPIDIALRTQY